MGSSHSFPSEDATYPKLGSCVLLVAGMTGERLLFLLWMLRLGQWLWLESMLHTVKTEVHSTQKTVIPGFCERKSM